MSVKSVLIVSDFACINGGQAKVAIDSARMLADHGLDVTYFAAVGPADPMLDYPGITLELLDQRDILSEPNRAKAMASGIWNRTARKRLEQTISRFDPATSVLHCHGYAKALSPSIGPLLCNGPLRAVYTMHEYFLACPNGGFYDYQRGEICTRKALGASCLSTNCDVRKPVHKAWRVARQLATWGPGGMPRGLRDVIYISETQRRAMAPYLSPETRLHHVPNPVPLPDLPPVDAPANDVFLFVGRLNPEKGGLMFAKAAKAAGVKAVFVGDGPEADAIRAVNPDALITGWLRPEQVQEWLSKARALVFASLWYETFGLVACEALGRGVPVVVGSWNAAAEWVEDSVTGVVYCQPDAHSLQEALRAVQRLEIRSRPAILGEVEPKRHLQRILAIYENMLGD